jgi:hypothetical protein
VRQRLALLLPPAAGVHNGRRAALEEMHDPLDIVSFNACRDERYLHALVRQRDVMAGGFTSPVHFIPA